ncbi:MAG: Rpn family recombination-promoting nuclease/putative transposase [Myxococcota bacterium]
MQFMDPRIDFAFQKIFGTAGGEDVLRSLLNALLYGGRDEITDLALQDPDGLPRLRGLIDSYLDVRVRRQDHKWVLVRVQVLKLPGSEQRALFNAAKQACHQVAEGQNHISPSEVVVLAVTDFVMFSDWPKVESCYRLFDQKLILKHPANGMELVFVELPKFGKTHEHAVTLWEKWLCFLKEAGRLETAPDSLADVPQIKKAFHLADYESLTVKETDIYTNKAWWWSDHKKLYAMCHGEEASRRQIEAVVKVS